MKSCLIGICGGSASGKTTLSRFICTRLGEQKCRIISLDSYYRNLLKTAEHPEDINFDHPNSFDLDLLNNHLEELLAGHAIEMPVYDFSTHQRIQKSIRVTPAPYLIVEGLFLFNITQITKKINLKLFVDTPNELRFARRIQRDVASRNRSIASITEQYQKTVQPMFNQFVMPNWALANSIIDGNKDYESQWPLIYKLLKELC